MKMGCYIRGMSMNFINLDLRDMRETTPGYIQYNPFPHQTKAFEELSKNFTFPINSYKGGLLVLPTGGGKTFTAVNWICHNVLPKNIKVIWFAQSSYLLNQAFASFSDNALEIINRDRINIRVVSSSSEHSKSSTICSTDDVLIITTQTAILNFNTESRDINGNVIETEFKKFIKACAESGLFVVLDEAHHAPAYGFRNLWNGMKDLVPNFYILGLTATPTHNDKQIGGWLFKIFDREIIYEANQNELIHQKILAIPHYIEKPTGKDLVVNDELYNRLVRDHRDLPEGIIQMLADDSARNNYIVDDYIKNRNQYGKTIVFADRWPQCVYIKEKLVERGIKADAVFTKIHDKSNLRSVKADLFNNEKIINDFKKSKEGVLVNIRMLTEGVDIPDVKTVMLTRQTTSSILMTQMVGRALRGEKAGGGSGKDSANVVLFIDNWKGLIDVWAHPGEGLEDAHVVRGYRPYEIVSIHLVEQLSRQIESGAVPYMPYLSYIPVGWYMTDITVSLENDNSSSQEEMQHFIEYITIYDHTKEKFERFIDEKFNEIPDSWSDERLDERSIEPKITEWRDEYFDLQKDQLTGNLLRDLVRISRHIAKNKTKPEYHSFEERENYDIDRLVKDLISRTENQRYLELMSLFDKDGSLWKFFYKDFRKFVMAFELAKMRIVLEGMGGKGLTENNGDGENGNDIVLTEAERGQIKKRDGYTCQCCFRTGRGVILEIDHIIPVFQGGKANVENSQTLCKECNMRKGTNAINFKSHTSPSIFHFREPIYFPRFRKEHPAHTLIRIINFFYYCQAVCDIHLSDRRNGKYYSIWEVELYQGNNTDMIKKYKPQLIKHMRENLGLEHLEDIRFITVSSC